jgi:methylated-DNA-[protein]-cysteine S-methyltransferase
LEISTAYYKTPIGIIFIKSYGNSIAEITFVNSWKGVKLNDDEIDLTPPKSRLLKKCIKQLDEYFAGKRKEFDLKLTFTGSEFQRKVWSELANIPYGKNISYLELSKRIKNVGAIRAVGTANGCNKICIVVPCHRVIGSDGSLVGYGGDLWRKKWLLDHETKHTHGVQTLF